MSNYDLSPLAKEMEARAKARERLRDAAPDLLAALKACLQLVDGNKHPSLPARQQARAAIQKAEGNNGSRT